MIVVVRHNLSAKISKCDSMPKKISAKTELSPRLQCSPSQSELYRRISPECGNGVSGLLVKEWDAIPTLNLLLRPSEFIVAILSHNQFLW